MALVEKTTSAGYKAALEITAAKEDSKTLQAKKVFNRPAFYGTMAMPREVFDDTSAE